MKISRRQLKEILGDFIDYGYDDNYKSYYPSDYFHYNDILKFMHMNGEDASNPKVSYTEEELAQYKPLLKRQTSRLILLDKLDKNGHYDKYITYLYNQITNHAEIMQRRDQQTIGENKMKITKRQLKRIIRKTLHEGVHEKLNSEVTGDSSNLDQEVHFGLEKDVEALCRKYSLDDLRYSQHGVTAADIFEELKHVISQMDPSYFRSY